MGILQELFREQAVDVCYKKPCLWSFNVRRTSTILGVDLGLAAERSRRPGLTFKYLDSSNQFRVVFLTLKDNDQPVVDIELCCSLCEEMRKGTPRVFVRRGKRVFQIPVFVLKDNSFSEFCSTCSFEIVKELERVLNGNHR